MGIRYKSWIESDQYRCLKKLPRVTSATRKARHFSTVATPTDRWLKVSLKVWLRETTPDIAYPKGAGLGAE
ncbi:hypothetical protein R3I93_016542 [Phoxinus phoxinus]|uniref:Uncharacterized protein n=1 Tax=Phoxinus phoxinus TaxID=58324 RepID=A0AAN9CLC4_9TELE